MLALAATAVVVAGTASQRHGRLLVPIRAACVAFCGLLAAARFLRLLARWAFAVACVACLLAIQAVALRYARGTSLRVYLEARGDDAEPASWPAFEHGFRRYTRDAAARAGIRCAARSPSDIANCRC